MRILATNTEYSTSFRSSRLKTKSLKRLNGYSKQSALVYNDNPAAPTYAEAYIKKRIPQYISSLANDLSIYTGDKIKPEQLSAVMTKGQFINCTRQLNEANYTASQANIQNGIFRADFHTHTNYSDGDIEVKDLMEQAAQYGDIIYKKTGKKFLFGLSDHDGAEGVKEALRIIAENPSKFEHIKFIPASEISFPFECQINSAKYNRCHSRVEMPEVLVYGINPFSENTRTFFNTIYTKRQKGLEEAIRIANEYFPNCGFTPEEFRKFLGFKDNRLWKMHQHWAIVHYIKSKAMVAQSNKSGDFNRIFADMIEFFRTNNLAICDENIRHYLSSKNMIVTEPNQQKLGEFISKIIPKIDQGSGAINAPYEINFTQIAKYVKNENAVMAFAHPGYTFQNILPQDGYNRIKELIDAADGTIFGAEKYHQAYLPQNITEEDIAFSNNILKQFNLINIGGRDNHSINFTNFG